MTVDLGSPGGTTPAEPVMPPRVPRFVFAGAGVGAGAVVAAGEWPAVRGLAGSVLLVAVVAGGVAAARHGGADRPGWWLVGGGVTLMAASVVLGPGHASGGAARWAAAAGLAVVVVGMLARVVLQDGALSRFGLAGLVGFVGASLTVYELSAHTGAFSRDAATTAATVVCVLAVGVLTMVLAVRSPTVADRLLLAGAAVLVVSQPVLVVSPAWGRALAVVGGALAATAPVWLSDRLPCVPGEPSGTHLRERPGALLDEPASSWRAWSVMVGASLALPVGALVVTWDAGDAHLLASAVGQLVLVVVLVVALLRLVRDRARHVGRATALAETDPVTGLANRQRFQADVAQALETTRDTVNVTVVLVALESFSELHVRLGEAAAEGLQVAAARRLVDQAPDALAVGQLHADVVGLVFDVMDPDRASVRAQHFVDVLREPIELPQLSLSVGAVVGMATGQAGSADATALLASAELALAAARGPAGPLVRFTPELERRDAMAAQLVGELSEAIARGEVQAYFQPQMDLATGQVTGAEALVRWLHPSLGLLSPAAFVPAAEVTGAIRMITVHVLDQALYWCARWARAGRPFNVSVNLSARDLLHARLVDDVREALARYSMPASRLELEITETMAMADVALSQRVLTDLARLGVTISIDDYGTGYGSLAYLQQLPVRRLKIDRTFVSRILDDEASMAIVRSTIELAGELGLDTVAEGVEDEATAQRLRDFGCGSVQGFGIAAPMSPESFERAIWRLEHRSRPGVAAVRSAPAGHHAATPPAAYPSVAQAYHDLHTGHRAGHEDPGWWTGDRAVAPGRAASAAGGSAPATGAVPPAPQVPRPAHGSPLSAPSGMRASEVPAAQGPSRPGVVQPRVAPSGPVRLGPVQPSDVQPSTAGPTAVPAPRGWVPQRQRAALEPEQALLRTSGPAGQVPEPPQAPQPPRPDAPTGWPAAPATPTARPATSAPDAPTGWPDRPVPYPLRPSRRELRHQRERDAPVTGAGSVTGLRAAATSERTTGRDPA